jgi:hypothetical protein
MLLFLNEYLFTSKNRNRKQHDCHDIFRFFYLSWQHFRRVINTDQNSVVTVIKQAKEVSLFYHLIIISRRDLIWGLIGKI